MIPSTIDFVVFSPSSSLNMMERARGTQVLGLCPDPATPHDHENARVAPVAGLLEMLASLGQCRALRSPLRLLSDA